MPRAALVGATLALGALLPLARVLRDPAGWVPGSPDGDVYKHVWPFWHTPAQLAAGTWPHTDFLHAPEGGLLLDVMLIPSLLMLPLEWLAGPVLATNTWLFVSLLLVGGATFALARAVTGSTVAALAAGMVVQTSPYLLGHVLTSGVHERLAVWVFPVAVLALERVRAGQGRRPALLLALAAAVATVGCATYGVFLAALVVVLLPFLLWPRDGVPIRTSLRRLILPLVAVALVLVAVFLVVRAVTTDPWYLSGVGPERTAIFATASAHDVNTLATLLDPLTVSGLEAGDQEDELWTLAYLGWVPLLGAVGGVGLALRRRPAGVHLGLGVATVVTGLVFVLASLGSTVSLGPVAVPNPAYVVLGVVVPGLRSLPPVWQLVAVSEPLMPVGLALLIASFPAPRERLVLAGALVLATIGERALVLPVPLAVEAAPGRAGVAFDAVEPEGILLDVPRLKDEGRSVNVAYLAQTRHERPITLGINVGRGRWDLYGPIVRGRTPDWRPVLQCVRTGGVRWIAVHRSGYASEDEAGQAVFGVGEGGGVLVADDGEVALFDLQGITAKYDVKGCVDGLSPLVRARVRFDHDQGRRARSPMQEGAARREAAGRPAAASEGKQAPPAPPVGGTR